MRDKDRRKLRQMNDSEYYTRPEIVSLLSALLRNMTKKRLSVSLVCEDSKVAYTTGERTVVNVLNQLTQGYVFRNDKLLTLMGLVGHEAGHILYSDFKILTKYIDELESGDYIKNLTSVDSKYEQVIEEMKQYYTDQKAVTGKVLASYGKEALNILEDGFINPLIMASFPGNVAKGLKMLIEKTVEEYPSADELLKEPLCGRLGIVHQYVLCGSYLGNAAAYQDSIDEMISIAEPVVTGSTPEERVEASFGLLMNLWQELKTVIDETVNPDWTEENQLIEHLREHFGKCTADMPDLTVDDLDKMGDLDDSGDDENEENSILTAAEGDVQQKVDELIAANIAREERREKLQKEHEKMNLLPYKSTSVSINALLEIPEDADERVKALRNKLNIHIRRMVQMTKTLLEEKEGGVLEGQICGGRIGSKLYRKDQKIFSKNVMPGPQISMAVSIVIDESGSMTSDSERNLKAAREMAFMAYQFCRQLEIPVSVVGHGVRNHDMNLDIITDFEVSPDDESMIATISSHCSNYDAYAIEYVGRRLLNRPEDIKILFVISDGAPSYPYNKRESELIGEIRDIVSMLRRRGVIVIATAMDMESEDVQAIYEKDCMNISDMSRVPMLFPRLIAKYIS